MREREREQGRQGRTLLGGRSERSRESREQERNPTRLLEGEESHPHRHTHRHSRQAVRQEQGGLGGMKLKPSQAEIPFFHLRRFEDQKHRF